MASSKVIIIGSGVSGLSCASELIDNGVTDLLVLEAQDRLGGRTYTFPLGNGAYVEYGAQWVHGSENNPLYDITSSLGLLDENLKTVFGENMYFATPNGNPVDEGFVDTITEKINELFDKLKEDSQNLESDRSVGSLLEEEFEGLLNQLIEESVITSDQKDLVRAIYEARLKEEKNDTACGDLNQLSALGWNAFEDSAGDNMINLKYGYGALVEHFRNKIGDDKIFLNEVVKKIEYPEDSGEQVKITTENRSSGKQQVFYAEQCVCTIPLGYLKANYKSLFKPNLPEAKANAIEKLGFGLLDKIFLIFDGPAFDESASVQGMQILWPQGTDIDLNAAKKYNLKGNKFYKGFSTFEVHPKFRNVMYTFLTGNEGAFAENISDEALLEIIYELLTKCFPEAPLLKPKKLIRSKWLNHEFTRGSYTHIKLQSAVSDVEALAEPLNSKLFFAGEHTSVEFVSTVHGAYQTGLREARNILGAN